MPTAWRGRPGREKKIVVVSVTSGRTPRTVTEILDATLARDPGQVAATGPSGLPDPRLGQRVVAALSGQ
jgi:hypothetical protein